MHKLFAPKRLPRGEIAAVIQMIGTSRPDNAATRWDQMSTS